MKKRGFIFLQSAMEAISSKEKGGFVTKAASFGIKGGIAATLIGGAGLIGGSALLESGAMLTEYAGQLAGYGVITVGTSFAIKTIFETSK